MEMSAHFFLLVVSAILLRAWYKRLIAVSSPPKSQSRIRQSIHRFDVWTRQMPLGGFRFYCTAVMCLALTVEVGGRAYWQGHFVNFEFVSPYLVGGCVVLGLIGGWRAIPFWFLFLLGVAEFFYIRAYFRLDRDFDSRMFAFFLTYAPVREQAPEALMWGVIGAVIGEILWVVIPRFNRAITPTVGNLLQDDDSLPDDNEL